MSQQPKHAFRHLLVVMTDRHIGNLLVSLYAIKAAQQQLNGSQTISCVIDYHLLSLATFFLPDIDFIPCNIRGTKLSLWKKLKLFVRMVITLRRRHIDTAVDLYGHSESHMIARLSGADFTSAFYSRPKLVDKYHWSRRDSKLSPVHQVDSYLFPFFPVLGQLTAAALKAPKQPAIYRQVEKILASLHISQDKPLVVIHPGAGKDYKLWPSKHWQQLIALLESHGRQVLLIGAAADRSEVEAIMTDQSISPVNGFECFNLIETIHLGNICEYMIGNDSGPTHLMATTATRVYSIFGPTNSTLWAPLSDNSHIIQSPEPCLKACSKQVCARDIRCLEKLSAKAVFDQLNLSASQT